MYVDVNNFSIEQTTYVGCSNVLAIDHMEHCKRLAAHSKLIHVWDVQMMFFDHQHNGFLWPILMK